MFARTGGFGLSALMGMTALAIGAPAWALPQFNPTGTERAHTQPVGPGIEWDTSGLLSGGQISYNSGTGILSVTSVVDTLNYYDPLNGACPTDTGGSNCALNYAPDLDMTVQASFVNITLEPVFGDFIFVNVNFETTGNPFDLLVTDPSDGDSVVLKASFTAGDFDGTVTTGLQTKILYNTVTEAALFETVDVSGFLTVDGTTLHSSLFDDGSGGLDFFGLGLTQVTDVNDGLGGGLSDLIAAAILGGGVLPSFTAEGDGEAFAITSGQFLVPEPSTAMMLGLGLVMLTAARKHRA